MWWHTVTRGRGNEGETSECSVQPVLFTLPRNMLYPALLPLMRTPRLPVIHWPDAPRWFKWTRPFRRKTKSGFCSCAITFQTQSTVRTSLLNFSPWRQNLTFLSSRSDNKKDRVLCNHNWCIYYINICKYTVFRLIKHLFFSFLLFYSYLFR